MSSMSARAANRVIAVNLGGRCALTCYPCDCRDPCPERNEIRASLSSGGARVVFRGAPEAADDRSELVAHARAVGFGEVAIRTNAHPFRHAARCEELAKTGTDTVVVPLFAHASEAHDRVARSRGALVATLVGMRALDAADLHVEIEVPILSASFQRLAKIVELAHRSVPRLRRARFFFVDAKLPEALAPAALPEIAGALSDALETCDRLGVQAELTDAEQIPLCTLAEHAATQAAHVRFDPKARARGALKPPECTGCEMASYCSGPAASYTAAHGAAGLRPYVKRAKALIEAQRTTPAREWTDERRQGARDVTLLVLRPTVNCNQDCGFCSANQTSNNVWEDPTRMLKAIARAGQRGVTHISFSGGEPTLSKHLASFVDAARRVSIPSVELVTNAVLLDREEKVRALRQAGLTNAFVSLHAHDEELSSRITQKRGDLERTLRGIDHLLDSGVEVVLNHVINTANYRYLSKFVEFARERFEGRTRISFAFVTPQYKALENIDVVPKLSTIMPYLRRAMYRAVDLRQRFIVGSRQGIPPCFLGEFAGWSDVFGIANQAQAEDAFQKQRSPACDECRFSESCTGLWKPYVARFGLDELRPVPGPKLRLDDPNARERSRPNLFTFDDVVDELRDRDREWTNRDALDALESEANRAPDVVFRRTRPLRVALLGSGQQARRIARAAARVEGLSIDAVASPHASAAPGEDFGFAPRYDDAEAALDDVCPEAAIVAASTHAHGDLVTLCVERGIPVLVEKPVTGSRPGASRLLAAARKANVLVMPMHQLAHADGLPRILEAAPHNEVRCVRHVPGASSERPRNWSRAALYEGLYHLLSLVGAATGYGVRSARCLHASGGEHPEKLRFMLTYENGTAEIVWEAREDGDELLLTAGPSRWRRRGPETTLTVDGSSVPVERRGSDLENALFAFKQAVLTKEPPLVDLEHAVQVLEATHLTLHALEDSGTKLAAEAAPRHAASRGLSPRYD